VLTNSITKVFKNYIHPTPPFIVELTFYFSWY